MYIDRMQSAVIRMRALINDLLDYSRVTTKGKPFEPVDLTEILRDVVSDLEVRIEEVQGAGRISRQLPQIEADPDAVTSALPEPYRQCAEVSSCRMSGQLS